MNLEQLSKELRFIHRQRCVTQGCVYFPDKNGKPSSLCSYCGELEPMPKRFFGEPILEYKDKRKERRNENNKS